MDKILCGLFAFFALTWSSVPASSQDIAPVSDFTTTSAALPITVESFDSFPQDPFFDVIPSAMAETPAEIPMEIVMQPRNLERESDSIFISSANAAKISTEMFEKKIDGVLDFAGKRLPLGGWELALMCLLFFYKRIFNMIKSIMIMSFVGFFLVAFLAKNTTVFQDSKKHIKEIVNSMVSSSLTEHVDRFKNGLDSPEIKNSKKLMEKNFSDAEQ